MRKFKKASRIILCFLSGILISNAAFSQAKPDLYENATKNFQLQNYAMASIDLNTLIKQADNIHGKKGGNIYFMYSHCLLNFLQTNNDTILKRLDILKSNLPIICSNYYKRSLLLDKDLKPQVNADLQHVFPYLITTALKLANMNLLIYANVYIYAADGINRESYYIDVLDGIVLQYQGKLDSARTMLSQSINNLEKTNDSISRIMTIHAYNHLAMIDNKKGDNTKALEDIQKALTLTHEAEEKSAISKNEIANLFSILEARELSIYAEMPEKEVVAIEMFKKAMAKKPTDYALAVSYADLLTRNQKVQAIEAYQKAINMEPKKYEAYNNLGVMYINEGIGFFELAQKESSPEKTKQLMFLYEEKYSEAYNWLQIALTYAPKNLKVLYSLRRVAAGLYYPDDYDKYNQLITKIEYYDSIKNKDK